MAKLYKSETIDFMSDKFAAKKHEIRQKAIALLRQIADDLEQGDEDLPGVILGKLQIPVAGDGRRGEVIFLTYDKFEDVKLITDFYRYEIR